MQSQYALMENITNKHIFVIDRYNIFIHIYNIRTIKNKHIYLMGKMFDIYNRLLFLMHTLLL
jgi:hypothetical protein